MSMPAVEQIFLYVDLCFGSMVSVISLPEKKLRKGQTSGTSYSLFLQHWNLRLSSSFYTAYSNFFSSSDITLVDLVNLTSTVAHTFICNVSEPLVVIMIFSNQLVVFVICSY